MKFEIKHRCTGAVLFSAETATLKLCVEAAVKSGASLDGASLYGARLVGAILDRASLVGASLDGASLDCARLVGAILDRASLYRASLVGASLVGASLDGASLYGASLVGASLDGASLVGAILDRARLDGASLDGAIHACAQIAFSGHGECGRMLTAVQLKPDDAPRFFCGCFTGDESELRKYITDGAAKYRKTRTLALDTALILLAAKNEVES